jgi:hypothetical protein
LNTYVKFKNIVFYDAYSTILTACYLISSLLSHK